MRLIDAYRATLPEGELAHAEELQREPRPRSWWPLIVPAWCLLAIAFVWGAIANWTAESRDRPAGEIHNTGPSQEG